MGMNQKSKVKLNNGVEMPILGFGTFTIHEKEPIILALKNSYGLLDTAAHYGNEEIVQKAIQESGVQREEIFLTTKLQPVDLDKPREALELSLKKLKTDYVDLWLIHKPEEGKIKKAWKEMEKLYKEGKCKAIGVANFNVNHLKEILEVAEIIPAVNQIDFNIYCYQKDVLDFCKSKGIILQAYRPLFGGKKGFENPEIKKIAKKYHKSVPQIMIRWVLQKGAATIPKSTHEERIIENKDVFDFEISEEDIKTLDGLNENVASCSWNPMSY